MTTKKRGCTCVLPTEWQILIAPVVEGLADIDSARAITVEELAKAYNYIVRDAGIDRDDLEQRIASLEAQVQRLYKALSERFPKVVVTNNCVSLQEDRPTERGEAPEDDSSWDELNDGKVKIKVKTITGRPTKIPHERNDTLQSPPPTDSSDTRIEEDEEFSFPRVD